MRQTIRHLDRTHFPSNCRRIAGPLSLKITNTPINEPPAITPDAPGKVITAPVRLEYSGEDQSWTDSLDWNVSTTVDGKTVQAGINAAVNGDTVLVADGTYTGAGNKDLAFGGRLITVRSANGPETCIIDCEGNGGAIVDPDLGGNRKLLHSLLKWSIHFLVPGGNAACNFLII